MPKWKVTMTETYAYDLEIEAETRGAAIDQGFDKLENIDPNVSNGYDNAFISAEKMEDS